MIRLNPKREGWINLLREAIHHQGAALVLDVLDGEMVAETKSQLYAVQKKILNDIGHDRLNRAGELGVLRLMMKYSDFFFKFLELPQVLDVVDATVSNTAIMHLQNGFILPSFEEGKVPSVFQNRFHMDFPRVLNGCLLSVNTFFAIDDFTAKNGGTLVSIGTHQNASTPSREYLELTAQAVECPAGSMLVFDSTLWHAAGLNISGRDRLGINQQFTRSYIKQQVDYVRALGDGLVDAQNERTKQLLGWYTRVVTSLEEYYQPSEKRLYRSGQG